VEQFTAEAIREHGSHPGSWAGPIVVNGLLINSSWRPTGPWKKVKVWNVRLDADDFVIAVDALTGKTKWQTIEPGGMLRGGGKREGFQVGPVYRDGVVYWLGSTARLFAHDATTGKKLWESDAHPMRAATLKLRETTLAMLEKGEFKYDLTPEWCASLNITDAALIVPDKNGGITGVDRKTGEKKWFVAGATSRWATPAIWKHESREYILTANEKGELRLIDPADGKVLWTLTGLGPTWFTLTPGKTHVLVNVVADSGKPKNQPRKAGRLGAVRLSTTGAQKDWLVGDGVQHTMPVWLDDGARIVVLYKAGRFLVTNCWQGSLEPVTDAAPTTKPGASEEPPKGRDALLVDEESGRALTSLSPAQNWNDQLSGWVVWVGDRLISRADSYHGPTHGGRKQWLQWTISDSGIVRLPGKMDLGEFDNAYEVTMPVPLVGGLMFERTIKGTMVCYDLRK
jgi:hypothetical protein